MQERRMHETRFDPRVRQHKRPWRKSYIWSWLFYVNFILLQWFFVRLCQVTHSETRNHKHWELLRWVVPCTGWWTRYRYWPYNHAVHRSKSQKLDLILERLHTMSVTLSEALDKLNVATNNIATEVAELRTQLANVATPEQLASLDSIADRLNGLAADPTNPVPTDPPATPAV